MNRFFAGIVVVWLVGAGPALATPVLDQSNPLSSGVGLNNAQVWQQQVTDGTGGLLSSVTLYSANAASVDAGVTVQIGVGSAPFTGSFAFTSGLETLTNAGTSIDVSAADINLTPGEKFVIQVSGGSFLSGASFTLYPGGDLIETSNGDLNFTNLGTDMAFETFISPSTTTGVPEPLTLSLFGAGLAGAAAMRRRKAVAAE